MNVLKFGGSSVGSVASILNVKKIVESRKEPVIVVVSALGGITDLLINTANRAAEGNDSYYRMYNEILDRHENVIMGLAAVTDINAMRTSVHNMLDELGNIFRGIYLIRDLSDKTLATVVSYGERISSLIIASVIEGAIHVESRELIKTEKQFRKHIVDFKLTNSLVREKLSNLNSVAVLGGFISSDKLTNENTNLGRGGSDYTASIIAAAINSEMLEIWTDVDGFMTADPKIINNTYVINHLTFVEAMELCNFGAKVIYPPTIFPVYHKNIPIIIKNTFNPECSGTLISSEVKPQEMKSIKGISSINDTCLITVTGLGMVGVIGVNYRIFRTLAKSGISVFIVSQASSENTTSFGVRNEDADLAISVLREEFSSEIEMGEISDVQAEKNLATVAIVGENMKHTPGIAGKLFNILGRNGINVIACAQGASETNISFVIELAYLRKALNVIHDSFFLSEYQALNIFLSGTGLVGRHLLSQIKKQKEKLLNHNALRVRVVGLANSRQCIFNREGIDLDNWEEELKSAQLKSSPDFLKQEVIKMNIFNPVFVDCTASPAIAGIYNDLLGHNINVVTANKIAASSAYENYSGLKKLARKKGIKFLFETNVGAGLPIINTINSLINSGDEILKIEAVVSGTLNYIFNVLSEDVPLSKAIRMAKDAGYAEPDPRLDLNGSDVIRKLVILSRESGYKIEQSDVEKKLFIPDKYFEGDVENFWKIIPELDAEFEKRRKKLLAQGKRYRFVASLDNGHAKVELREIDSKHPFYHLEGSNNVILLTTERYKEYPMEIKGYGAGAAVTAAGVFADIISIANIR
ncbi:MAG: bifunctional aspartate kinase/homoserine dehydrogenase I [Bacteroidales bacterium]|nr:bifunctional aspartate kinase/homoserine dehydrogenase I [Bacteroidales bacterium]